MCEATYENNYKRTKINQEIYSKCNAVHISCNYITYIDVCTVNLLHSFVFVVHAPTCFGFFYIHSVFDNLYIVYIKWQTLYISVSF